MRYDATGSLRKGTLHRTQKETVNGAWKSMFTAKASHPVLPGNLELRICFPMHQLKMTPRPEQ